MTYSNGDMIPEPDKEHLYQAIDTLGRQVHLLNAIVLAIGSTLTEEQARIVGIQLDAAAKSCTPVLMDYPALREAHTSVTNQMADAYKDAINSGVAAWKEVRGA